MSSQRDAELMDVELERAEQAKGPEARRAELDELTTIYVEKGLAPALAKQVCKYAKPTNNIHHRSSLAAGCHIIDGNERHPRPRP